MSILNVQGLSIAKPSTNNESQQAMLLNNINFEIDVGEIACVIGPNGAGKSTLLKAIMGDWQYQGRIEMPDIASDAKMRARQLTMLSQFSLLNFPYRVHEVVGLARIPHNTGYKRDHEIIDSALELMDIGFLKNRLYTELSGGEKQRVQLARIFAQIWDPVENVSRLLLLDEPTTALDLGHQKNLMEAVKYFAQQGVAILMVLHDINLAARYADRLLALLCGEQLAFGPVSDVVTVKNMQYLFNIDIQLLNDPEHSSPIVVSR